MSFFSKLKEAVNKASEVKDKVAEKIKEKVDDLKEKVDEKLEQITNRANLNDIVKHQHKTSKSMHINNWACICNKCQKERDESIEVTPEHEARRAAIQDEFDRVRKEIKKEKEDELNTRTDKEEC